MPSSTATQYLDWSSKGYGSATTTADHHVPYKQKERYPDEINGDLLFKRVVNENSFDDFELIYKHYYDYLCHYAWKLVDEKELAEEVVSEVFYKLWRNINKIEIKTSFKSYLFTAVRNQSFDHLKKSRKARYLEDMEMIGPKFADRHSPLDELIFDELYYNLERTIEKLPQQCRLIFKMSRDQGLRYREIACALDISIKTVETQMGRALKKLRKVTNYN
ncbi:RNA polymerase sigma-70 factor [Fulvivirgaceae bacterium BMA12]|uniref:RNA polymerase sigma-70 factor n=1 Tax=Agaribacillus aureus TaxID=3051825 RepID=A0ABT8L846_9BACT|nr:RNA polymerase sigma-70 factor [Fulvivirgaceae bacterium BMA12]